MTALTETRRQKRLDEFQREAVADNSSAEADALSAEKTSWISPARTPGILFAAMLAPTPLPQIAIPRSTSPDAIDLARGITKSG